VFFFHSHTDLLLTVAGMSAITLCSMHDCAACPYSCLVFPCPCSGNCCGAGLPPCGYNPLLCVCRYPWYHQFAKHANLKWIRLLNSPWSVPITEFLGGPTRSATADFTLIVSHGNGQDLQYLTERVVPHLHKLQMTVNIVCYEYPGYSLSALPTSEAGCLAAAEAAYHYVRHRLNVPARQIVLFGISLGTGPAMHIAANFEVGGLILQSPYTSIGATALGLRLARRLWCIDLFRSYSLASRVSVPVQLYHGSIDEVVPPQCSRDLAPLLPQVFGDEPVFVEGAGHNDVIETLHARGQLLPMLDRYLHALASMSPAAMNRH
jgi:pimeloyl-ACP methyl ester carboxylesterase